MVALLDLEVDMHVEEILRFLEDVKILPVLRGQIDSFEILLLRRPMDLD